MSEIVAADELKQLIERIERLEEEKKATANDIKDVYAEGKSRGYSTKMMRELIKARAKERHILAEDEALRETYFAAMGLA